MLILHYCSSGTKFSDFEIDQAVDGIEKIISTPDVETVYNVSNIKILDEVRARIAEDKIDHSRVMIRFEGRDIPINKYGAIPDWPVGFHDNRSERILRAAMNKRKKERL